MTIAESFKRSERMLEWEDDWDDEGAKAITRSTFDRARTIVDVLEETLSGGHSLTLPAPDVAPGPGDGSIDLHWRQPKWELLLNVPADFAVAPDWYGDTLDQQNVVKGGAEIPQGYPTLIAWLATRIKG